MYIEKYPRQCDEHVPQLARRGGLMGMRELMRNYVCSLPGLSQTSASTFREADKTVAAGSSLVHQFGHFKAEIFCREKFWRFMTAPQI